MILDGHTHIFPPEVRNDRDAFCELDEGFSSIYRDAKAKMAGVEDLIASMDESGVERSIVCGFSWKRRELCFRHNQYLFESAARFPNRLIVFLSLPMSDADWSGTELERGLQGGAKGVGEIAFYDRPMTSGDIEAMRPTLTWMEQRGIPLLLHVNELLGHPYPGKGVTPLERFHNLVLSCPRLIIILAHWGGGFPFYELMPEVAQGMGHVYYDTAASPFLYTKKIYKVVCEIVGSERILFGTDFPLARPGRYFQELRESGLTEEEQKQILGLNLSRLLSLEIGETR
jgi:predicted TIM-barrel fold metal-dependent hydrolase